MKRTNLSYWALVATMVAVITHLVSNYSLASFSCPGARPCAACVRLPAHRRPCAKGCWYFWNRGSCNKWAVPVDGTCTNEIHLVHSKGYTVCSLVDLNREFLCCRWDHGCWANPYEPNGQWGGCLRNGYDCFNPTTGGSCPFTAWTEGIFCHEQNGRPCCGEISPCNP